MKMLFRIYVLIVAVSFLFAGESEASSTCQISENANAVVADFDGQNIALNRAREFGVGLAIGSRGPDWVLVLGKGC